MFELCLLAIHPFPYFEHDYITYILDMMMTKGAYVPTTFMLSDFLFAFMTLRVYFVIKSFLNMSLYSEIYSQKICKRYGIEANTAFYIKALLNKKPGLTVLFTAFISIMWSAYILRIFERITYN